MTVSTVSTTACILGEGAFWHPDRGSFLWFDILGRRLYEAAPDGERHWSFDRCVSAAGRIDRDRLLIATATDLVQFDLETGAQDRLVALEADNPATRSNDGRADPQGGFWIGTMGMRLEPGLGAIYRYYKGELRRLYDRISIPNAQCFSPDGGHAFFTDTPDRIIRRVALDRDGWPKAEPEPWIDLRDEALNPDGAVIDAEGNLWNAQWGAGRVACHGPDGAFRHAVDLPASQITCPAFGGADLSTLYVTSAAEGLTDEPQAGRTFAIQTEAKGQEEHRVIL
ncbi:SMP-30/gluconolactonase/LRE family protein [Thetidibacter halocola]|uniref:SMP-30/gluconolactonase/LRE family protein n=1 Tax=Thetidibacter halocola TaxID=2827239 RepID=A0A8J7WCN0_9RHOB|nr:SMP-30/gluconolactonase/LRE family protein [Thetidibacter halocola]MBS0123246.1 SMP-30/gluconolactonase/LRE family protein [Thetidibacter halocola]